MSLLTVSTQPFDLGSTIIVLPWPSSAGSSDGTVLHDSRSTYVEQFWLGIIGPTALWLLRRLADGLDAWPDGFEIGVHDLAGSLGVAGAGRHGPLARTITRCAQFGLLRIEGAGIEARRELPTLTSRQVSRLPESLREAHAAALAEFRGRGATEGSPADSAQTLR